MITYKFTLKSKANSKGEYPIIIVFIKDRENTSLSIGKTCQLNDWSPDTERLKKTHSQYRQINELIEKYRKQIKSIIHDFEMDDYPYSVADLVSHFKKETGRERKPHSYTTFQEGLLEELKSKGKLSSYGIEKDTLASLKRFFNKSEISFRDLTADNLYKYEAFLYNNKNSSSTIGIRMRTIRATMNKAIKREIIPPTQYPFRKFKASKIKESGKKEFLTEDEITILKNTIPTHTNDSYARDFFLLSFYGRGINFADLMLLKKTDIYKDTITYQRQKTGVTVSFKLNDFWHEKIKEYGAPKKSEYIFDIIKENNPSEDSLQRLKKDFLKYKINDPLIRIMKKEKISKHITFYCARHSFATLLKFKNVSLDIIKEALGHKDIKSTMSYLNSLPSNTLDQMIEDVINF